MTGSSLIVNSISRNICHESLVDKDLFPCYLHWCGFELEYPGIDDVCTTGYSLLSRAITFCRVEPGCQ